MPVFNYLYFINRAANFVEMCNIYVNQMVVKVAVNISNSDELLRNYDSLYLVITFLGHRVCYHLVKLV